MKLTQDEIDAMPLEEKLELSEALWRSISANGDGVPMPEWHKLLLCESLERLEVDPTEGSTWTEVKARLQHEG